MPLSLKLVDEVEKMSERTLAWTRAGYALLECGACLRICVCSQLQDQYMLPGLHTALPAVATHAPPMPALPQG